jgi:hypothetical protein
MWFRKRRVLEFWLSCYQRGASLAAIRCEIVHPSGARVFAENAAGFSFPPGLRDTFGRDVSFVYPDDFTGGNLPAAVSGTYEVVWLGKTAHDAAAIVLVEEALEVEIPPEEAPADEGQP